MSSPTWLVVGAVLGGGLGALGPAVLARLPEPDDPEPDKTPYAELARTPRLGMLLALASAAYAGLAGWFVPHPYLLPVWLVLAAVGPLLAFVDWRTHLLPYLIVAPAWVASWVATAIGAAWGRDARLLLHAAIGNVVVFGAFWLLHMLAYRFFGGGFGYGDVRLSAVLGVALGPLGAGPCFWGAYAGFVIGAVVGLVRQRGRLRVKGGPPLAFGPFMIIGAVVGLLL